LLHPVETADVAALDGRHVAPQVLAYLSGKPAPTSSVELHTNEPFRWVFPKVLHGGDVAPPRERLLLWTDEYLRFPLVEATQAGRVLGRKRLWWPAPPGRVFRVHSDLLDRVDYSAGPVTISVTRR